MMNTLLRKIFSAFGKGLEKAKTAEFLATKGIVVGKNFKLSSIKTALIHPNFKEIYFGNDVSIRNNFNLVVRENAKLKIDHKVFFNNDCSLNVLEELSIGENTLFGENVKIYDHNHSYSFSDHQLTVAHKKFNSAPVSIGKNCWLGSNVVVLKGVKIGDNSIIGAGCVIHKDVPENSLVVFKQEQIIKPLN